MSRSKTEMDDALGRRRYTQSGFSLVELIVAFSILLVLSTMAVPLAGI